MTAKWCPYDDLNETDKTYMQGINRLPLCVEELDKILGHKVSEEQPIFQEQATEKKPTTAEESAKRCSENEIGLDNPIHLYGEWKSYQVYRPEMCYLEEQHYKYPVIILVDKDLNATFHCDKESKRIFNKLHKERIKENTAKCYYYHGEKVCPYDDKSGYKLWWDLENTWVNVVMDDYISESNYTRDLFPDLVDDMSFDTRPMTLKGFLFSRCNHWTGVTREEFRKTLLNQTEQHQKQIKKKELERVTDIMIDILKSSPDNSEYTTSNLYALAINEESNVLLLDEFKINERFNAKAEKEGYIVDNSGYNGLDVGLPYNIPAFYRSRKGLIKTFNEKEKSVVEDKGRGINYIDCCYYESYEEIDYDEQDNEYTETIELPMQIIQLSSGCCTGNLGIEDNRVTIFTLKGRGEVSVVTQRYTADEGMRKSKREKIYLHKTVYVNALENYEENATTFSITNTGSSELIVYIAKR